MCGKHITIGAIVLVVVAIATAIILPNIMQYTNNDLSLSIPTVLLLVGLTALIISINRYIENPTKRLVNWILERGTLKIGMLIILLSLLLMIALGYVFAIIQIKLFHPCISIPPIQIRSFILKNIRTIIYLLTTIFLGVLFVHLGFKKVKRERNFILLLKCTLYFSVLGVPFICALTPIYTHTVTPAKTTFYVFIAFLTPITGLIPFILQWFRYIGGTYTITISGIINFTFFLFVLIIHLRIVSIVYKVPIRESLKKLLVSNFLLMLIWIFLSLSPITLYCHQYTWLKIFVYQLFPVFKSVIMP